MLTFPRRKYANNTDIYLFYEPPAAVLRYYKKIRAENRGTIFHRKGTRIYLHALLMTNLITFKPLKKRAFPTSIRNIVYVLKKRN